jgi:NIPSNAP
MKRREFIKGSVAASSLAAVALESFTSAAKAAEHGEMGNQEYYELRAYRTKSGADRKALENYLEKAAIPAMNRIGCKPIGVFVQQERTGNAANTEVRDPNSLFLLIPYPSLETFGSTMAHLHKDEEFHRAGAEYLHLPKENPAFERIDSWLLLAFAGMPRIDLPAYCREKKPRLFEMRTYESHSELKAIKKVQMFNSGEIELMKDVGLGPIFFGQALIGPALPHLTYMLSAEDPDAHKKHWEAFGKHPTWDKLKNDPQFADTVSKIRNWFLAPTSYSQI